jgi:hypothetical protein
MDFIIDDSYSNLQLFSSLQTMQTVVSELSARLLCLYVCSGPEVTNRASVQE